MNSNNNEWKRKRAARMTLEGMNPSEIALELEVKRQTAVEWMQHDDFKQEYAAITQDLLKQMEREIVRANFMHYQARLARFQKNPVSHEELSALTSAASLLNYNAILPKLSHGITNGLPMEGMDLNQFNVEKTT